MCGGGRAGERALGLDRVGVILRPSGVMSGGTITASQTLPNWLQPYLTGELSDANTMYSSAVSKSAEHGRGRNAGSAAGHLFPGTSGGARYQRGESPAAAANQFETSGPCSTAVSCSLFVRKTPTNPRSRLRSKTRHRLSVRPGSGSNSGEFHSGAVGPDEQPGRTALRWRVSASVNTMTQAAAQSSMIESGLYTPGQEEYQAGSTQQQQHGEIAISTPPYNALSWYSRIARLERLIPRRLVEFQQQRGGGSQDAGLGLAATGTAAELASMY